MSTPTPYPPLAGGQAPPQPPPPYPPVGGAGAPPPGPPPPPQTPATRPRTPVWAVLLATLGVLVVLSLVAVVLGALAFAAGTRTEEVPVTAQEVRELRVVGSVGGVRLRTAGAEPGEVRGTSRLTTSWNDAEVEVRQDGDVLEIRTTCPDSGWPRRCDADHELTVDPAVDVVVQLAVGGLRADGLAGDVQVDLSVGGVELTGATSQVVEVTTSTGGSRLEFDAPPQRVAATAAVGGVSVVLPDDGTAYDVTAPRGGAADSYVEVPRDPSSSRTVDVSTSVGGAEVLLEGSVRDDPDGSWDDNAWKARQ